MYNSEVLGFLKEDMPVVYFTGNNKKSLEPY